MGKDKNNYLANGEGHSKVDGNMENKGTGPERKM